MFKTKVESLALWTHMQKLKGSVHWWMNEWEVAYPCNQLLISKKNWNSHPYTVIQMDAENDMLRKRCRSSETIRNDAIYRSYSEWAMGDMSNWYFGNWGTWRDSWKWAFFEGMVTKIFEDEKMLTALQLCKHFCFQWVNVLGHGLLLNKPSYWDKEKNDTVGYSWQHPHVVHDNDEDMMLLFNANAVSYSTQ